MIILGQANECWPIVRWHQNILLKKWHLEREEQLLIETLWWRVGIDVLLHKYV